nr:MAG TPA: hypothetical protein [Caudoviricetes sp.]
MSERGNFMLISMSYMKFSKKIVKRKNKGVS